MPTKKPIIHLHKTEDKMLNSVGQLVFDAVYKINEINELSPLIDKVIIDSEGDVLLSKRQEIIDNVLLVEKDTTASYRIYNHIKENLQDY